MNKAVNLVVAAALAALATGCASANANEKASTGSARELAEVAGRGVDGDYSPLASPKEAVGEADLIVQGTLVEVGAGIQVSYPDAAQTKQESDGYATFVIAVDKVLDGDASRVVDGKVYVAVRKGVATTPEQLSALNPRASVVAVLDDITTWRPVPEATVVRPAGIPAAGPLYYAYHDGLWLQGTQDDQMYGIDVEHEELTPAWGGVREVEDLATTLEKAAATG
ncbi:hypothetical protein [Phytohabitans rumicis]|uniref:Lipoprotein n=1 Tax=Phytohabitans rumicis TaxID=1076125 RepID=A0A6V8LCQ1_9ACTN|nr:hypothetical protein [Phytohabitans rumicis]GFJ92768.1 hypothetical protein Prum_064100 [Phytohabitans rumicis]